MNWDRTRQQDVCKVVLDPFGQYSFVPEDRDLPKGWIDVGMRGNPEECHKYIAKVRDERTA